MSIPRFSVRRPVTTGMIVVSVVVMGLLSLGVIRLDMYPTFERPVLSVNVPYPDASPAEVERRIVRPLEEALGTVRRIEAIRSTASQNNGRVELEFQPGTDMDLASLEVRERGGQVRGALPVEGQRGNLRGFSSDG